jgi:hypothetical protein
MEPETSLPHSQVPASCPYPEPAQSSPYPHTPRNTLPSSLKVPYYGYYQVAVVQISGVSMNKSPFISTTTYLYNVKWT